MDHNAIWVDLTIVELMHTMALVYLYTDGALHTVMVPREPKYLAMYWRWKRRVVVRIDGDIEHVIPRESTHAMYWRPLRNIRGIIALCRIFGNAQEKIWGLIYATSVNSQGCILKISDRRWFTGVRQTKEYTFLYSLDRQIASMRRRRNGDVMTMLWWCLDEVMAMA